MAGMFVVPSPRPEPDGRQLKTADGRQPKTADGRRERDSRRAGRSNGALLSPPRLTVSGRERWCARNAPQRVFRFEAESVKR